MSMFLSKDEILEKLDYIKETKSNQVLLKTLKGKVDNEFGIPFCPGTVQYYQKVMLSHATDNNEKIVERLFNQLDEVFNPFIVTSYKEFTLGDTIYFKEQSGTIIAFLNDYQVLVDIEDKVKVVLLGLISKEKRGNVSLHARNNWDFIIDREMITSRFTYVVNQYYRGEFNFNPFYQRGLVWTLDQKQLYIENLLKEKAEINITIIRNSDKRSKETKFDYEVLDGKQRFSTLIAFFENQFPLKNGMKFKDLSEKDVWYLMRKPVKKTIIKSREYEGDLTDEQRVHLFSEINEFGTLVDKSHIEKIKKSLLK